MKMCYECNILKKDSSMFCSECGGKNSDEAKFCKKCGSKLNTDAELTTDKPSADIALSSDKVIDSDSPPYPYVISTTKLVVLSTLTFGLYEFYWFYKHFKSFKSESNWNITPWARAFFAVFNSMVLFRRVSDLANKYDKSKGLQVTALGIAYFILSSLWRLPDPYWFLSLLTVLPLIPVQITINFYWHQKYGNKLKESSFGLGSWITTIIGGIILLLAVYGTLYPEEVLSLADQQEEYRSNFMESCTNESPELTQFCTCGADYLTTNYSIDELTELDAEYARTGQQTQSMTDTIEACRQLIP
jgi:hypothetical protein